MEDANQLEENEDSNIKGIFEIRERNRPLTILLKGKVGYQQLENYPQEADYYLLKNEEKKSKLEAEKEKISKEISSVSGEKLVEKLRRKKDLEINIKELYKEQKKHFFPKYLS